MGTFLLAQGTSRNQDTWKLQYSTEEEFGILFLEVISPQGERSSGGLLSPILRPGANLAFYRGESETGPSRIIIAVSDQITSVNVKMSDETEETVALQESYLLEGIRFGVLIHPPTNRVLNFELYDRGGSKQIAIM